MTTIERINNWKIHPSHRGHFAYELYKQMAMNDKIILLCMDLGWGVFDVHFAEFPQRCINVGASESAAIGIAVGLTYRGKIPVVYSITNFLLYRPFEFIRNYVDHEKAPVKLVGSGKNKDYGVDGFTHHSTDAKEVLNIFKNIKQYWPETKEEVAKITEEFLTNNQPSFISLKRG